VSEQFVAARLPASGGSTCGSFLFFHFSFVEKKSGKMFEKKEKR
jgi:hypothetical protein